MQVVCRLASSAFDFYSESYKAMSSVNLKGTSWDKWTATCLAKLNFMSGLAEYYEVWYWVGKVGVDGMGTSFVNNLLQIYVLISTIQLCTSLCSVT